MNRIVYFFVAIQGLFGVMGCRGGMLSGHSCEPPKGRYVNNTLLEQCEEILEGDIPYYAVEFRFQDSTTVLADNGFEQFPLKLSYDKGGCSGVMRHATLHGDMPFELSDNGQVILYDTAWTKLDKPSVFGQATAEERKGWGFRQYLNFCVFGFTYYKEENGKPAGGPILLLPNGQMNGMRPFLGYTLCYAGDCMEETDPFYPTVTFQRSEGGDVTYAIEILELGHRIRFLELAQPDQDVKGGRKVGEVAFVWVAP